jgi:transcriptional regulator with XRE-family HTH domain
MSSGGRTKVSEWGNVNRIVVSDNGNMPKGTHPKNRRREARIYLKEWLAIRGLTAEQLAGKLETSKSVVSKLMTGQQRYNQDWLERIAYVLDCEVADLYRMPDAPTAGELLASMPDDLRQTAINLLRDLARLKPNT